MFVEIPSNFISGMDSLEVGGFFDQEFDGKEHVPNTPPKLNTSPIQKILAGWFTPSGFAELLNFQGVQGVNEDLGTSRVTSCPGPRKRRSGSTNGYPFV